MMPVKPTYASKTDISAAAQTALITCGTNRQGATCAPTTPAAVIAELQNAGYLGKSFGLTRRGTIKRMILAEDLMDAAFSSPREGNR